ncbi:MAG: hypothetical protein SFU25_09315 [Candidatus Caenarcaniphilales bacterium]|nr:hypothetical protein [Candidatus Caenarcaniphilales bacterium]
MTRQNLTVGLLSSFALFTSFCSSAATIDEKMTKQAARIEQGIEQGELTDREAQRLQKEQEKIEVKKDKYENDGKLSSGEKAKLRKMQAKQSKEIYKQKNDWQDTK